jgi:hypothetical protein
MQISAYQIHNVLKVFSIQMIRAAEIPVSHSGAGETACPAKNSFDAPQSMRQTIIKKATAHVIRRISELNAIDNAPDGADLPPPLPLTPMDGENSSPHVFLYHRMDSQNQKQLHTFSITEFSFSSSRYSFSDNDFGKAAGRG